VLGRTNQPIEKGVKMQILGREITEAEVLQVSAIIVAAPRYMGAFASAVGLNIVSAWETFAAIETFSGLAMAVLEGWALAFTFKRLRSLPLFSFHWWVLAVILLILLFALPATATPYLVSSQQGLPVKDIFPVLPVFLLWAWSFMVAAIAPLIVAAVGYSDVEGEQVRTQTEHKQPKVNTVKLEPVVTEREQTEANGNGNQYREPVYSLLNNGHKLSPRAIAKAVGCSPATASKYIKAWESDHITLGLNGNQNGAH
jgi:membrane protein implicated in regulation of membrane protease activity